MVEHATENRGVHSSILCLGTLGGTLTDCGRSTVVVRLLAKEKVVGSNPIARSVIHNRRRGQVVRQGSAKPSSRVQIPSTPLIDLKIDAVRRLFI